jgi:DNA-binding protein YbaB
MSNFEFDSGVDLDFDEIERQRRRIEEIERVVAAMEVTGRSRGGEVTAVMKGTGRFTGISIDPGLLDGAAGPRSLETIGCLVLEAVNDGLGKLNDVTRKRFESLVSPGPSAPGVGQPWRA